MVKLIKHELYALFRVLIFVAAASLLFAAAGRIAFEADAESSPFTILFGIFYGVASLMLVPAAWFLGAARFYNTLFTGEGYLTFSLPLSSTKVVLGKLFSALIAILFSAGVCTVCQIILSAGAEDTFWAIFNGMFDGVWEAIAAEPFVAVEFVLLILVILPLPTLVAYAVLSLGQIFSSHRKLIIFALAVAVYVGLQVFISYGLGPIVEATDAVSSHLTVWLLITLCTALDAGSFFLVRYIFANKVNLL